MPTVRTPRWIAPQLALAICIVSGCRNVELERHVLVCELASHRFAAMVRANRTTRGEEQSFIEATERSWAAVREALGLESPFLPREGGKR